MLPPCRGPICTEMNPSFRPTRGSWGMGDAGDVDKPVTLSYTPVLGLAFYADPDDGGGGGGGSGSKSVTKVKLFDQIKKDLKGVGLDLSGVALINMRDHLQHDKLKIFNAWTNSEKEIYVNIDLDVDKIQEVGDFLVATLHVKDGKRMAELVYATILVRHELNHVQQFKKAKGRPKTYKAMCEYEEEAYGKDVKWLEAQRKRLNKLGLTDPVIDFFQTVQRGVSGEFKAIAALKTEAERKKAMIERKDADGDSDPFLPPHKDLDELYKAK